MSQVPATQGDMQFASTGLEDFSVTDAVLPRIKIDHTEGQWVDTLGGVRMDTLRFVALGLVKQRVLFHHIVDNDDVPMCKSSDFNLGFPNPDAPQAKSFPWQLSGFDPKDFPPDDEGNVKLPCSGCQLKEWGSNPANDSPYCSEQWTLPIYYETSGAPDGDDWSPAILTLQKSSIKPIRTYFTGFAQSNRPPFLSIGRGTLTVRQRGSVTYSVPSFIKEGESDRNKWQEFSEQFGEMRTFLTRPPVREIESAPASTPPQDNTYTGPPQQQAPAPAAEPQQAAPPQQQPDPQHDPWTGQPAQQEPPAQQAPAPPAPPQQQPAPPQQQPAPSAPPAQQPPTPPPAGQGLPF